MRPAPQARATWSTRRCGTPRSGRRPCRPSAAGRRRSAGPTAVRAPRRRFPVVTPRPAAVLAGRSGRVLTGARGPPGRAAVRGAARRRGEIHRVDPDFGSILTVSNRDSQSNSWVSWRILGQPPADGRLKARRRSARAGGRRRRRRSRSKSRRKARTPVWGPPHRYV